jgi:hypothetical protein
MVKKTTGLGVCTREITGATEPPGIDIGVGGGNVVVVVDVVLDVVVELVTERDVRRARVTCAVRPFEVNAPAILSPPNVATETTARTPAIVPSLRRDLDRRRRRRSMRR